MLTWAVIFLVLAVAAAVLGFVVLVEIAAVVAQVIFWALLAGFVVLLIVWLRDRMARSA